MAEKAASVQGKTLKDLQKTWRIAQDHLEKLQESFLARR